MRDTELSASTSTSAGTSASAGSSMVTSASVAADSDRSAGSSAQAAGFGPVDPLWAPELEMTLFQAIAKYRPVGVHKHFRILNIQRFINKNMGTDISVQEIWDHLRMLYGLEKLDELADEYDTEISPDRLAQRSIHPFMAKRDFALPADEFFDLMDERRRAEASPAGTPSAPTLDGAAAPAVIPTHLRDRDREMHPSSPAASSSAFTGSPEPPEVHNTAQMHLAAHPAPDTIKSASQQSHASAADRAAVTDKPRPKIGRPRKVKREESQLAGDAPTANDAAEGSSDVGGTPEPSRRSARHLPSTPASKKRR
ncbi:hypothetical protein HK105_204241 [Polyrhizophydium stewartii]|uniref:Uncharacterized protein n=1 Tax=Polyrhizophydium stewartii TaxID=2732419 RepID=A0ABR4N9D7_9FUNG